MATHTSVLAWRIPGTGEPGGLPSLGSHRVGHDCSDLAAASERDQTQKGTYCVIPFIKQANPWRQKADWWLPGAAELGMGNDC